MNIVEYPHPVLSRVAEVVTDFKPIAAGIGAAMVELMTQRGGMGLAAPQVGLSQRVFVINKRALKKWCVLPANCPRVWINPVITHISPECDELEEGCLSLPGHLPGLPGPRVKIMRHVYIEVECSDEFGNPVSLACKGMLARCVQHLIDILNGISIEQRGEQQTELRKQAIETAKKNRLEQLNKELEPCPPGVWEHREVQLES